MFVVRNILKAICLMVLVGVTLTVLIGFLSSNNPSDNSNEKINGYFRIFLLFFLTRYLPMIPFLGIMYFVGNGFRYKLRLSNLSLIMLFIMLYLILGVLFFGSNFWQIHNFYHGDFKLLKWFNAERRDMYFSIASFVGVLYFLWKSFYNDPITERYHS